MLTYLQNKFSRGKKMFLELKGFYHHMWQNEGLNISC